MNSLRYICSYRQEFDDPAALLQDPNSMFSRLVEQTGPSCAKQLKDMAKAVKYYGFQIHA